ncbi:MAG TPA: hypothetical protein VEY30_13445, partial [Myxococcaceae bacterium]|nr:hypothetical protein [Myxococcaceae bacterium]
VGGQLWALRFNHPDTTRWAGGRALRAQGTGGACARQPFYQVTANSVTAPGYLRSVVGTGYRFNLADIRGGECSATNLLGCVRRGCTLVTEVRRNICGRSSTYRREFTNANTATSCTDSLNTVTLDPLTNSNCCSQRTEAQLSYELRCTNSDASPVVLRWEPRIDCGTAGLNACGSSASGYVCNVSNDTPFDICSTFDRCDSPIAPPLSAFYSVKVFDDANPSRAIFNDAGGAATYDRNALLQSDLVQANPYDATAPPVTTATANGWYARFGQPSPPGHVYPQTPQSFDGEALNERTVTQASLIGGCAFWSTLTPNNTTNMCSTSRLSVHTQYRMNFLDGGPCRNLDPSLAATRYVQNQDTLPPAPPQLSVAVSPEGQVSLNLLSVSRTSGSSASNTPISASSGLAKDVYRLDVTRQTHACRHPEGATAAEKRAFAEANCSLK